MTTQTITKTNIKAFEGARDAVVKLETLSRLLTSADLETLEILLDKHSVNLISKSLKEAESGNLVPIEEIL